MTIQVTLLPSWLVDILNVKGVAIKDYKTQLNNANMGEFKNAQKLVDMILGELSLYQIVGKETNEYLKLSANEVYKLVSDVLGKDVGTPNGFVKQLYGEYILPLLSTDNTENTSEIIICMGDVKGEKEFFRQLLLSLDRYVKREDLLKSEVLTQYLLRKDVPVGLDKEGTASVKRDGDVSNEGFFDLLKKRKNPHITTHSKIDYDYPTFIRNERNVLNDLDQALVVFNEKTNKRYTRNELLDFDKHHHGDFIEFVKLKDIDRLVISLSVDIPAGNEVITSGIPLGVVYANKHFIVVCSNANERNKRYLQLHTLFNVKPTNNTSNRFKRDVKSIMDTFLKGVYVYPEDEDIKMGLNSIQLREFDNIDDDNDFKYVPGATAYVTNGGGGGFLYFRYNNELLLMYSDYGNRMTFNVYRNTVDLEVSNESQEGDFDVLKKKVLGR